MAVAVSSWSSAIFALSVFSPYALADIDAPCYLPNGLLADGFYSCDPTACVTSCCPNGYTCFPNFICDVTAPSTANSTNPIGTSLRGTCTNLVWNNPICGDYRLEDEVIDESLEAYGDDEFCCANDTSCSCSNGAFDIKPGRAQTIISIEGLEYTTTSIIVPATSVFRTVTILVTTLRTITAGSASPTDTSNATHLPEPIRRKPVDNPGVKAGITLAVISAVALIAILGWYIYRHYVRRERSRPTAPQPTSSPARPSSTHDLGIQGNATNLTFDPPMVSVNRFQHNRFGAGDAQFGNEYERNAPSRGPPGGSVTSTGSGGGWNGTRGMNERLSIVSDEDDRFMVRGRPGNLFKATLVRIRLILSAIWNELAEQNTHLPLLGNHY